MFDSSRRVYDIMVQSGVDAALATRALAALAGAGYVVVAAQSGEFVCRWVDVNERAVPPAADTIIRTVTKQLGATTNSATHWLDGLVPPPPPPDVAPR
jgi:hypothetical protein